MGLFTTVLHVFNKEQKDIAEALTKELANRGFSKIKILEKLTDDIIEYGGPKGLFYLITNRHDDWSTIIELNANIEEAVYLYELTQNLSARLNTYALSFHLHDGDVLYYNLEKNGQSLDGYSSDVQYFLESPAEKNEIINQRHNPSNFSAILPKNKTVNGLNQILNKGYWTAFDNNELDEDGVQDFDKYYVDELERFEEIGKYLEIYSPTEYPFANWFAGLDMIDKTKCLTLHADK